jgi:LysM repeat protein
LAQETPVAQEVRELRQTVQQQGKQIETLAQQVAKLSLLLETAKGTRATTEIVKPSPEPVPAAPPEIPKAEAVPQPLRHVVEKGETLTSVAKQHNVPLTDLQKANKITNDRKLQIGQTLVIPSLKNPETPAEKKETP